MQQEFSPGLLYSIAPENLSELHLLDEPTVDEFEWEKPIASLGAIALAVVELFRHPSAQ